MATSFRSEPAVDIVDSAVASRAVHFGAWVVSLLLALLAVYFAFVGGRELASAHQLGETLRTAQTNYVGPVLFLVVAVLFFCEQRWPAVARPARSRAHIFDAGYLLLFVFLAPFVALLNTGFAIEVSRHAPWMILDRFPIVPQIAVIALIILWMDAMNWLAHVANHRYAALWRYHALHHSQEDMSVFTTFRTHPLAHVSYLLAVLPALVLASNGSLPNWSLIAYGCLVTLPHANLRWDLGVLGHVVCSPAFHRLHHARTSVNGKRAVNYGFVFTFWDRLAGTAVVPQRGSTPIATGLVGRPVPVEQDETRSLGSVAVAQLTQPFRIGPR